MKLAEPCPRGPGHAGICRILARRTPWSASSRLIATKFNQTVGHIVGLIDFYTLQRPLRLEPAGSIAVARMAAVGAERPEALAFIALEFFERRDLFLVSRESGMTFP
jgi:hypothetical protein